MVPVLQKKRLVRSEMQSRGQLHHLAMEEVVDDASHISHVGVDAAKHKGLSYGVGLSRSRKVTRWCHC